jgi:hypothetical protein
MAAPGTVRSADRIRIYVNWNNISPEVIQRAEFVCARILATADVAVEWRADLPGGSQTVPGKRTIVVEFAKNTPPGEHPGALAYARVYEGVHIVVLYDRILTFTRDNVIERPMILAHVMAHEIAHAIQGVERHSPTGVMKARWDATDFRAMTSALLPFTSEDIDLIHRALR